MYADLVPDPVQNLSAAVNKYNPSVTLNWEPPGNVRDAEELAEYHIRFKPFGDKDYIETIVTGSATNTVLTRDSKLVPLKNYHFQARAQSGCCKGEWKEVTSFYGKHCTYFTVFDPSTIIIYIIGSLESCVAYSITFFGCVHIHVVCDYHVL